MLHVTSSKNYCSPCFLLGLLVSRTHIMAGSSIANGAFCVATADKW